MPHGKESAMCKWLCPRVAERIIRDCIITFGHVGVSLESELPNRLASAVCLQIGDGTADIMKIVITRNILGKEFLPY